MDVEEFAQLEKMNAANEKLADKLGFSLTIRMKGGEPIPVVTSVQDKYTRPATVQETRAWSLLVELQMELDSR